MIDILVYRIAWAYFRYDRVGSWGTVLDDLDTKTTLADESSE